MKEYHRFFTSFSVRPFSKRAMAAHLHKEWGTVWCVGDRKT
jgi:hypothetical protein